MARPCRYEFSDQIKVRVKHRGVCEWCGCGYDPKDPWEVHHRIYVEYGVMAGIPHAVLSCFANAALLHKGCHESLHILYEQPAQAEIDKVLSQTLVQTRLALR